MGSSAAPRSALAFAHCGRTSVWKASRRSRCPASTSPACCASVSASRSTSSALAYASWRFTTLSTIASTFGSTLCAWSIVSRGGSSPAASSQKIRNSSNGLTDPTMRSSSAYLRLLKWKPPSRPSSASRATISSMFVPCAWWPRSTRTRARSPSRWQTSSAEPQSARSVAQIALARVVGAVREPERLRRRTEGGPDVDALEQVLHGLTPHPLVGMRDRPELVVRVLEQVRVHGSHVQATILDVCPERGEVVHRIPREMERHAGRRACQPVHLGGVVDALVDISRPTRLLERREARARVAVPPGRGLDHECG